MNTEANGNAAQSVLFCFNYRRSMSSRFYFKYSILDQINILKDFSSFNEKRIYHIYASMCNVASCCESKHVSFQRPILACPINPRQFEDISTTEVRYY